MWVDITTPEIQPLTEKKSDHENEKTTQISKTNANAYLLPSP